ncbi:hypothetical protein ACFL5Y_00105 [Candidatus Omnitrophota bacterium]
MTDGRKKVIVSIIFILFFYLALEITARIYYSTSRGISFFSTPKDQMVMWYPNLKELYKYNYTEEQFNILLLGGSALTDDWGNIPSEIKKSFEPIVGKQVHLVNLAAAATNTRDSLFKYLETIDKKFDLVIVYHGINENRANNVPRSLWKDDYSHFSWYNEVNFYQNHSMLKKTFSLVPYFVKHLLVQIQREIISPDKFISPHSPRPEWVKYGKETKTATSYKRNLERIIEISKDKKEPLVIITFCYFDPRSKDVDKSSAYYDFTKIWGDLDNVVRGINVHNGVIRQIQNQKISNVICVDLQSKFPQEKKLFRDICHLTEEGSALFVGNLISEIEDDERLF